MFDYNPVTTCQNKNTRSANDQVETGCSFFTSWVTFDSLTYSPLETLRQCSTSKIIRSRSKSCIYLLRSLPLFFTQSIHLNTICLGNISGRVSKPIHPPILHKSRCALHFQIPPSSSLSAIMKQFIDFSNFFPFNDAQRIDLGR